MHIKKFMLGLSLLAGTFSYDASASHFQGNVTSIFVISGMAFVHLSSGSFDGTASPCSSASDNMYYMIDLSTAFGKMEYSNTLAAKMGDRQVYVVGDNSCNGSPYGPVGAEIMLGIDLK